MKNKRFKKLFGMIVCLLMVFGMFATTTVTPLQAQATLSETASDSSTEKDWANYAEKSTENIGRIWTDKSVFTSDYTFLKNDGTSSIGTINKKDGSDFLIAFSALSSASSSTENVSQPLDIVLVLDTSGSMADNVYSYEYNEAYDISYEANRNGNPSVNYYIKDENGYLELDADVVCSGRRCEVEKWQLNGNYVEPKTSADDTNLDHIQFYTRTRSGTSKMQILKDSVNSFVDKTNEVNKGLGEEMQHRLSVVEFSSNSSEVLDFTYVTDNTITNIKNEVDDFYSNGGTQTDDGMATALNTLQGARQNAKKVVILFTDGEPGDYGFTPSVANGAVNSALTMKNDGAIIYSVGIFSGANPSDTSNNSNSFMNAISSNYPKASAYNALGDRIEKGDYYKVPSNAGELSKVFDEIFTEITNASGLPTSTQEGNYDNTGYVTFNDQLGDFMQVDGFNAIVYNDIIHTNPTKATNGNIDTYVFEAEVDTNHVLEGKTNLNGIIIEVERSADSLQTGDKVTVKIPSSLIPLRYFEKGSGNTDVLTSNEAYPIRVFYDASLKAGVEDYFHKGDTDAELLEYITNNRSENGKISFYSNKYSGNKLHGLTIGDTLASFTPSKQNSFYYFTKNTPLYLNEACDDPAKSFEAGKTYYYKKPYYNLGESSEQVKVLSITPQSGYADFTEVINDQLNVKAGTRKIDRTDEFKGEKGQGNVSGTSQTYIYPEWNATASDVVDVHLGNNGIVTYDLPGTLIVKKNIVVQEGFTIDTTKSFKFTLNLTNTNESFYAQIYDGNNAKVGEQFTIKNGDKFNLKHAQYIEVYGLPSGTTYTVTETAPGNGYTSTSEVTSNIAGSTDKMIESAERETVTFTNTYDPEDYIVPSPNMMIDGIKNLGRDFRATDEFTFRIINENGAPLPIDKAGNQISEVTLENISGTNTSSIDFGDFKFEKPGNYVYLFTEVLENESPIPGIVYDDTRYRVTITIKDNNEGKLVLGNLRIEKIADYSSESKWEDVYNGTTVPEEKHIIFNNEFTADSTTITFNGTKEYNRIATYSAFTFKLEAVSAAKNGVIDNQKTIPMPQSNIGHSSQTGEIGFQEVVYTQDDIGYTYTYKVTENLPTECANLGENEPCVHDGITYDKSEHEIVIQISEMPGATEGEAKVQASITSDPIVFTNTYNASGTAFIDVNKLLSGREVKDGDSFTFVLKDADGNDLETKTMTKDNYPSLKFDIYYILSDLNGAKEKTFTYEIVEESGSIKGIDYDEVAKEVKIIVTDVGGGTLNTIVSYNNKGVCADNSVACFVNNYKASGTLTLKANKEIVDKDPSDPSGRGWLGSDKFTFNISGNDDVTNNAIASKDIVLPGEAVATKASQTATFGAITFHKAGNYEFVISELIPSEGDANRIPGMTYDTDNEIVEVRVTDNGDGTLTAIAQENSDVANDGTVKFVNTYDYTQNPTVDASFRVRKYIKNGELLSNYSFKFHVVQDENDPIKVTLSKDTAEITQDNIMEGTMIGGATYSKPGDYKFIITEEKGDITGVEYSQEVFEVVISVAYGDGGKLIAHTKSITKTKDVDGNNISLAIDPGNEQVTFDNTVNSTGTLGGEGRVNIVAQKVLENRPLENGEFSFDVIDKKDEVVASGVNDVNGNITFSPIKYSIEQMNRDVSAGLATKEGRTYSYQYDVVENIDSLPDGVQPITYASKITVKVTVTDNLDLNFEVVYPNNGVKLVFENSYGDYASSEIALKGQKVLERNGLVGPDIDGLFEFEITSDDENAPMPTTTKVHNDASGNVDFGKIEFTMENVFGDNGQNNVEETPATPDVEETLPPVEGSDENVDLNPDGENIQTPEGLTGESEIIETPSTEPQADDEVIQLTNFVPNSEEPEAMSAQRTKTFTYKVKEVLPEGCTYDQECVVNGVTYDRETKEVKISVVDNGDGTITVTNNSINNGFSFKFTNEYQVKPEESSPTVEGALTITKQYVDEDDNKLSLTADEFAFTLTDKDGNVYRASNDVNGNVEFDAISFDTVGTYEYTLKEVTGQSRHIVYDQNEYGIKAVVSDNQDGTLKVEWDLGNNTNVVFKNIYKPLRSSARLEIRKELFDTKGNLTTLTANQFKFELKSGNTALDTVGNDASGLVSFELENLDVNKEHKYQIIEVKGDKSDIKYDDSVIEVTVSFEEEANGTYKAVIEYVDDDLSPTFVNKMIDITPDPKPDDGQTTVPNTGIKNH